MMNVQRELSNLRMDLQAAIQCLETKYNISLKVGNCKYDELSFVFNIEGRVISPDGDKYRLEFEKYCKLYDLTPQHYKLPLENGKYILVGFNLSSPKFALKLLEVATGKEVKGNLALLKPYLNKFV